nr:MAG TPA: hypothetical protein [Bacteriophage sp.]
MLSHILMCNSNIFSKATHYQTATMIIAHIR